MRYTRDFRRESKNINEYKESILLLQESGFLAQALAVFIRNGLTSSHYFILCCEQNWSLNPNLLHGSYMKFLSRIFFPE